MAVTSGTVTQPLAQPVFDTDMRLVNFFNGRLLSGEDLRQEQDANREERRRLGRAMGEGVAYGLEVLRTAGVDQHTHPTLTITPGLAIDRRGQTLVLANRIDVSLEAGLSGDGNGSNGSTITTFEVCEPPRAGTYVAGAGLYLLTIGEVEGKQGRAPVSGLGNIEASCNTKYLVPGVRFRLIQLPLPKSDLDRPDLLRNRVAYRCFIGDDPQPPATLRVQDAFFANPFGPPVEKYGLIDDQRPNKLKNCEVPLALVYLTADDGLAFVDMWAARRRLAAPTAAARFPLLTDDRRAAEGEAMFMQFQDQIEEMRLEPTENLGSIVVTERFSYLPPVGLLPLASGVSTRGFAYRTFFGGRPYPDPVFIDGAQVQALLRESLAYPPIVVSSKQMVWLYLVRENVQSIDSNPRNAPQAYLIFSNGHMPFRGDARFNLNRGNYSNYAA